jgi:site-specific DNA-methyltransferase (adenine-specific)
VAEPYYADEAVAIYHGDCREIMPALQPVDAVVTDPPYGINDKPIKTQGPRRTRKRCGFTNDWHPDSDWDAEIPGEAFAALAMAAPIIATFGHWRMREKVAAAIGVPLRAEIIWFKDMHTAPPCPVAPRDERIWLFSPAGIKGQHFETSVWPEPVIPTWGYKHHKNEKPLALMRRLVAWISADDAAVLDPFMGSGTTLRAAKDLGRRAIGIEIDERYCEIAAKRMAQEVLPLVATGGCW